MSYGVHLFRLASSTTFFQKILVNLLFQSLSPPPKTKQKGKKQKEKEIEKPLYRLVIVNPILLPTGASDISNTIPTLAPNHLVPTPFPKPPPLLNPITSTPPKRITSPRCQPTRHHNLPQLQNPLNPFPPLQNLHVDEIYTQPKPCPLPQHNKNKYPTPIIIIHLLYPSTHPSIHPSTHPPTPRRK